MLKFGNTSGSSHLAVFWGTNIHVEQNHLRIGWSIENIQETITNQSQKSSSSTSTHQQLKPHLQGMPEWHGHRWMKWVEHIVWPWVVYRSKHQGGKSASQAIPLVRYQVLRPVRPVHPRKLTCPLFKGTIYFNRIPTSTPTIENLRGTFSFVFQGVKMMFKHKSMAAMAFSESSRTCLVADCQARCGEVTRGRGGEEVGATRLGSRVNHCDNTNRTIRGVTWNNILTYRTTHKTWPNLQYAKNWFYWFCICRDVDSVKWMGAKSDSNADGLFNLSLKLCGLLKKNPFSPPCFNFLFHAVKFELPTEEKVTWFSVTLQASGFLDLQQFLQPQVHGRHGDLQGDLQVYHDVAVFPGSLQDCREQRAVGASDFHAPTASDAPRWSVAVLPAVVSTFRVAGSPPPAVHWHLFHWLAAQTTLIRAPNKPVRIAVLHHAVQPSAAAEDSFDVEVLFLHAPATRVAPCNVLPSSSDVALHLHG